jgi:uncharacterized PurR-regulated membrane protein YhhQ (DUF165 family)
MIYLAAYILTILGANILITRFGFVAVGFGLLAPAGVYAAGASFVFRDLAQDRLGKRWAVAAIVIGAALSAFLSPALALASGIAFLVSELCDMAVYTPLRERGHRWVAWIASNVVGAAIDSALFLLLAFGALTFWPGQFVGKFWVTLAFIALRGVWQLGIEAVRRRRDLLPGDAPAGLAGAARRRGAAVREP